MTSRGDSPAFSSQRSKSHFDFVIDTNVCDRDVDNVHPSGYAGEPFVASERSDSVSEYHIWLREAWVEWRRRHPKV
jgi:hypothetical protein